MNASLRYISLLVLFALPTTLSAQQIGTISGRVTGVASDRGLPGVHVVIENDSGALGTTTDKAGRYELDGLPAGTYRLTASMVGYQQETSEVRVEAGAMLTYDVSLHEAAHGLDEVVVQATRMSVPLSAVSGSVTVVGPEQLEQQTALSSSLGDVLGRLVPGLGVSTGTPSSYGQSLRGRALAVMIDGVPQSTTRNTSRDLATIDPSMIERVEVIRGTTALYGDGATGGIVNIITRRPAAGELEIETNLQLGGSVSAPGDGLRGRLAQRISGRSGAFDYTLGGSYRHTGGFYDAEGDLIPPDPYGQGGLAMRTSHDLHGKLGYTANRQRLQLAVNHFRSMQDTDYVTDPAVNAEPPGEVKSEPMQGFQLEEKQGTRNTVASVDYRHDAVHGGRLHAQAFFRNYLTRFNPFDGRPYANYQNIIQSYLESTKYGARLEMERMLHRSADLQLLAGADYTDERTQQPVAIIDSTRYDASGGLVYEKVGERPWVPLMNPRQVGLFTQFSWSPLARLDLQGGVRYEWVRLHVDDFTTLVGGEITGGTLAYNPVLINAGAVLHTSAATSLYAAFSQGFSLTDLGLYLRGVADGFEVGNKTLDAQKVNNIEVGVRGTWHRMRASVAGFYNQSDLGTTSAGLEMAVVRAPERVYGAEATLDVMATPALTFGGTLTYNEGENDADEDGGYLPLNTFRIQPIKATGYVEYQTSERWSNRLQMLYSGTRDRPFVEAGRPANPVWGTRPVESYTIVDLVSTLQVGPGRLTASVENLLNRQYFPVVSQLMWNGSNSSHSAAPGATLTVGYSVTY